MSGVKGIMKEQMNEPQNIITGQKHVHFAPLPNIHAGSYDFPMPTQNNYIQVTKRDIILLIIAGMILLAATIIVVKDLMEKSEKLYKRFRNWIAEKGWLEEVDNNLENITKPVRVPKKVQINTSDVFIESEYEGQSSKTNLEKAIPTEEESLLLNLDESCEES